MKTTAKSLNETDRTLIQRIRRGETRAFEEIFCRYYHELCALAYQVIGCPDQARDVVQDVFFTLWQKRQTYQIDHSVKAYLFRSVWNQALNNKEKDRTQQRLQHRLTQVQSSDIASTVAPQKQGRLVKEIWKIVEEMAERRKCVFTLHRRHGLSYREIAAVMNVSRKTVENHMGLALQEIRDKIDPALLSM